MRHSLLRSLFAVGLLVCANANTVFAQAGNSGGGSSFGNNGRSITLSNAGGQQGNNGNNNSLNSGLTSGFGNNSAGFGFGDTSSFGQSNSSISALGTANTGSALGMGNRTSGTSNNRSTSNRSGSNSRTSSTNRSGTNSFNNNRNRTQGRAGGISNSNSAGNRDPRAVGAQRFVKPVVQISLPPVVVNAPQVQQSAVQAVAASLPTMQNFNVAVNSAGVATINGSVNNEHDRRLAAALLELEPGVRSVDNNIQISASATTPNK